MSNWNLDVPDFTTSGVPNSQNESYNLRENYYQTPSNLYTVCTMNVVKTQQYYNSDSSYNLHTQEGIASSSNSLVNNTLPDISKSNLTPTAKEFKPNSSYKNNANNGAVKKNTFKKFDNQNDTNSNKKNKKKYTNNYRYNDRNGQRFNYSNYNRNFNNGKTDVARNIPGSSSKNEEKISNTDPPESNDYFKKDYRYNNYKKPSHELRNFKSQINWRKKPQQEYSNKPCSNNSKNKCKGKEPG